MALAIADSNGIKRICTNCGTRYYDMGKTPVTCPSCNTEYIAQAKPKAQESLDDSADESKGAVVDITENKKASDDSDDDDDDDVVSLDDLEEDFDDSDDDDFDLDDDDIDGISNKSKSSDE